MKPWFVAALAAAVLGHVQNSAAQAAKPVVAAARRALAAAGTAFGQADQERRRLQGCTHAHLHLNYRRNGVRIERIPGELDQDIKRLGERFSREWVRSVGNEANDIFVPYYTQP